MFSFGVDEAGLIVAAWSVCLALVGLTFIRYHLRGFYLDPTNMFLLESGLFFAVQVPFILFPGNLYILGLDYTAVWPQIWNCFLLEALYLGVTLTGYFFLTSSYINVSSDFVVKRILLATSFLFSGHRYYAFFLIPIGLIIGFYAYRYGAALLLVDKLGTADARSVVLRQASGVRFIVNFANGALATLLFYLAARSLFDFTRRQWMPFLKNGILFACFAVAGYIVAGTRSYILGPLVGVGLSFLMVSRKGNKPLAVLFLGLTGIALASILDILREGHFRIAIYRIFVTGNTFADFRDLVWAFTKFHEGNQDFFIGRTYLASWLSFIPSSIFPFRDEWAWGRAILRVIGWSNENHFGIRTGLAGGPYFNGGVPLVIVTALLRSIWMFLSQKTFNAICSSGTDLFKKIMFIFISSYILRVLLFPMNFTSLWPTYVAFGILVLSFTLHFVFRRTARISNRDSLLDSPL